MMLDVARREINEEAVGEGVPAYASVQSRTFLEAERLAGSTARPGEKKLQGSQWPGHLQGQQLQDLNVEDSGNEQMSADSG